ATGRGRSPGRREHWRAGSGTAAPGRSRPGRRPRGRGWSRGGCSCADSRLRTAVMAALYHGGMTSPPFPATNQTLLLDGPAGALEVAVDLPEPEDARALVVVICHPLPTEGGSMHNKVVTLVARAVREVGAPAVRVHCRGTGQPYVGFDHGTFEQA